MYNRRRQREGSRVIPYSLGITFQQEVYAMKLLKLLKEDQGNLHQELEIIAIRCRDCGRSETTDQAGLFFAEYLEKLEAQLSIDAIMSQPMFKKLRANNELERIKVQFSTESEGYYEDLLHNFKELYFDSLYNAEIKKANLELIAEIYKSSTGTLIGKVIDKILSTGILLYFIKKTLD